MEVVIDWSSSCGYCSDNRKYLQQNPNQQEAPIPANPNQEAPIPAEQDLLFEKTLTFSEATCSGSQLVLTGAHKATLMAFLTDAEREILEKNGGLIVWTRNANGNGVEYALELKRNKKTYFSRWAEVARANRVRIGDSVQGFGYRAAGKFQLKLNIPIEVNSASVIVGLGSQPSSTVALDTPALAFEHVLASLARLEARLDASKRRAATAHPPSRPDPDPPYLDWQSGREETVRQRPILMTATAVSSQSDPDPPYLDWQRGREETVQQRPILTPATAVSSQSHLGVGGMGNHGGTSSRGLQHAPLPGASLWERYRVSGEGYHGRQPTVWDNPAHRLENRPGRHMPAWDNAWGRHDGAGYFDTPRYDQFHQEQPRYEKMKAPRFDGSDAANVNFAATTKTDEAGGFVAAGVSAGGVVAGVPMVVGGDPPDNERSDPGGYKRVQQIQPHVQSPMQLQHQQQISQAQFQRKQSGGFDLASPDSASMKENANKIQMQQQVQESGYVISNQYDQNHPQMHRPQQFVHSRNQYIPTGVMPYGSYYSVYPSQPQQHHRYQQHVLVEETTEKNMVYDDKNLPQGGREERRLDALERRGLSMPEEPYICSVCGWKCKTNMDLKMHFRMREAEEDESDAELEGEEAEDFQGEVYRREREVQRGREAFGDA
ncbi:hypothetical protein SASPL_102793 [Salvia splendens]|uniref:C2H2-type domain-containing protein n=1 Tax=Salvia splendens TaxID=180675 RepID=A0A8X9ADL8_SALSN|nr:hypothetical protein SASPL_102793 [Salvia splendens]